MPVSGDGQSLAAIAERGLDYVHDGAVVGLGTGRAASAFVEALGARVKAGLRVRGIPTSETTAQRARELGIPLVGIADVDMIDVTLDGADEVDPRLDLIKGYGGALVREKIVAASSRQRVMLVGSEKLVPVLGSRGRLPVEIVPFALPLCRRVLPELGLAPALREVEGKPWMSDNGNYVLDCRLEPISDALELERRIHGVPGVVGSGLFLGMADVVLIQDGMRVEVRERRRGAFR
jgi:ribose 5-phosphate isomerase A